MRNRIRTWWRQLWCAHHWHPADAMIAWRCCRCVKETDGWPADLSDDCWYRPVGHA